MNRKKGFTLIELVVVMAIIAVLSLLIIAAIAAARRASVEAQNRGNARTIEVALEAVASKNNGAYCATAANAATGLPACNANQTLSTLGTWLAANPSGSPMLSNNVTGTCATGGGSINLAASQFTIYVSKANGASCDTAATSADSLQTITH